MMRILFFLLFVYTRVCAQGPIDGYLKGEGKLDLAFSYSANSAKTFEGADQSYNEPFKGTFLSAFAEYGISEHTDVVVTVPYVYTSDQRGLQDGSLHIKVRSYEIETKKRGNIDIINALGISTPLGNYEPLAAGALGQRATVLQARLLGQWNTKTGPFVMAMVGYNERLDRFRQEDIAAVRVSRPDYIPVGPKDYWNFLFKIGLPAAHYYLDAWVERQVTNGGSDYTPFVRDLPQAYGVTYTQIGGTAYYSAKGKRGVFLSSGYILEGRNVSKVLRLTAGFVIKL